MMTDAPSLDKRQIRRMFSRWQAGQSPAAIPAQRLWERVECMAQSPRVAADIGGNGAFLSACYPQARIVALDFALPVLADTAAAAVCADAEALPFASGSLQLVWSNLCIDWLEHRLFFAEAMRVLQPGGLLVFTVLGHDTLGEMRQVFAGERTHSFIDMHDVGDALLAAGFAEPIMEREQLTFTYACAADALTEARRLGAGNARRDRRRLTKTQWHQALEEYQQRYGNDEGRVYATYEVIYATAWCTDRQTREMPLHFHKL